MPPLLPLLLFFLTSTSALTPTDYAPAPPLLPPKSPITTTPTVHIALPLDADYLRGTIAAVHSILLHASSPHSLFFHFLTDPSSPSLAPTLLAVFPHLRFRLYPFDPSPLLPLISPTFRPALQTPLNFARAYLADLLPLSVHRVVYLDSDVVLVDDVARLWEAASLSPHPVAAPEYCHANFTSYFTPRFWAGGGECVFARRPRRPCYFNTGVMVLDLRRWRAEGYRKRIEGWMAVQREERIYELGSLPPFLLVFAGEIEPLEHRWNQHGLGGDNLTGKCREVHPGPVSLMHWSGKEKPWVRLDAGRPCPVDRYWKPYDLYRGPKIVSEVSEAQGVSKI